MINYPDSSEYEPIDIYAQRQERIEERRRLIQADREARQRARDLSRRIRTGQLNQELPSYSPPQPQIPEQPEPPNPVWGAVTQGLEMLGRPGQAIRSAMAAPLYGTDPLQAGLRGLQGQSISPTTTDTAETSANILQNKFGLGEGPSFGPFNARGVAGFGIDVVTDPLSYIPIGNINKAKLGARMMEDIAPRAATTITEEMAKIKPNPIVSAASKIPGIGGAVKKAANIIDPRMVNNSEAKKAYIAHEAIYAQADNEAMRDMQILKGTVKAPFETITPEGAKPGINTMFDIPEKGLMPTGDVMQQFRNIDTKLPLSPEQTAYFEKAHQIVQEGKQYAIDNGINFDEAYLPGGDLAEWFPRMRIKESGDIVPEVYRNRPASTVVGSTKPRTFPTQAKGIQSGKNYVGDPLEVAIRFKTSIRKQVADQQFLAKLEELGVARTYQKQVVSEAFSNSKAAQVFAKNAQDFMKTVKGVKKAGVFDEEELGRLEAIFPDYTKELREVVSTGNKAALGSFLNKTKTLVDEAKITAKDMYQAYRDTSKIEKAAVAGMMPIKRVKDSLFKGVYFKPEEGKELAQLLSQKANTVAAGVRDVTAIPRITSTTLDVAYPMLQGLPLIAMDPTKWGVMMKAAIQTIISPDTLPKYIAKHQDIYKAIPDLAMANPEFMPEAAGTLGSGLGKVPGFKRLQASFEMSGLVARTEMAKALYPAFQKANKLDELGTFVNRATGVFSSQSAGISPTQRAWEAAALFAPQYMRASLALVGYALQGGIQGQEARKLLTSMMVVGPAMYTKIANMMGQEPQLDPSDPRFLSIQVGHDWVGVGSIWMSMARLVARSVKNPESLLDDNELQPNPLVRFWRSRSSPTASTLWDVIDGKTYLGADLNNPLDFGKDVGEKFLPMTASGYLLQNPPSDVTSLPSLLVGARVFPISNTERLETISREQYGKGFNEISPLEQVEVRKHPDVQAGREIGGELGKKIKTQEQVFTTYNDKLEQAAQAVLSKQITRQQFRTIQQSLAQDREAQLTLTEGQYAKGKPRELDPRELERKKYLSIFEQADPITGQIDFDAAEEYLTSLPQDIQTYIKQKQEAGIAQLPEASRILMSELLNDRRRIRPYWNIWKQDMEKKGLYDLWRRMDDTQQADMKETTQYKTVTSQARKDKERFRSQHPEIDALLLKWGYVSKPIGSR